MTIINVAAMTTSLKAALDDRKLTAVAYSGALADVPTLVAQAEGFFTKNDLDVDIVDFASGPAALAAIQGGSADVAPNSGYNQMLINANTASPNKKLVQVFSHQPGGNWALIGSKKLGFEAGADLKTKLRLLKGKTIGVPAIGSEGHLIVRYLLNYAGLDPDKDVTFFGVGLGPSAVSSFQAGQIDAAMIIPPGDTLFKKKQGVAIFDMAVNREIPGLSKWDMAAYVTTSDHADQIAKKLGRFQAALDSAIAFVKDPANTKRVAQIWSQRNGSLPVDQLAETIEASRDIFTGLIDCAGIENAGKFGLEIGFLKAASTCETLAWKGASRYLQR